MRHSHEHADAADVNDRGLGERPGLAAVDAVLDDGALGMVDLDMPEAVLLPVVNAGVAVHDEREAADRDDGEVAGLVGDLVVALELLALDDQHVLIEADVLDADVFAADRVGRLEVVNDAGAGRGHEDRVLLRVILEAVARLERDGLGRDLQHDGLLGGAVGRMARADQEAARADVGDARQALRPGLAAVGAVGIGRALGVVDLDARIVRVPVVHAAVAVGLEGQQVALRHLREDDEAAVGLGAGAGREGEHLLGGVHRLLVEQQHRGLVVGRGRAGAQEAQHLLDAAAHAVDLALVGVGGDDGENFKIVHAGGGDERAVAVAVEVVLGGEGVKAAEHGAVVHVVAVQQAVAVGKAPVVAGGEVDRAGEADGAVNVMRGVVEIVRPLHDGVIDVGVVQRDPRAVVLVDLRKVFGARERLRAVVEDVGAVLQQLEGRGGGAVLGVEGVVQDVAGVKDQNGGE